MIQTQANIVTAFSSWIQVFCVIYPSSDTGYSSDYIFNLYAHFGHQEVTKIELSESFHIKWLLIALYLIKFPALSMLLNKKCSSTDHNLILLLQYFAL